MLRDVIKSIINKGNKRTALIAFVIFIQGFLISNLYAKEPVSVGVVNVTYLMEKAPQSEAASTKLKSKFSPVEKKLAFELDEINKLEAELNKIKLSKKNIKLQRQKERDIRTRKRKRSRSLQDFREELRFARDGALDDVQKEVFKAIDEVRAQLDIDIILQDYVSASQDVDITPLVLDYLKNKLDTSLQGKTEKPALK